MKETIEKILSSKWVAILVILLFFITYHFLCHNDKIKKVGVVQMDKLVYEYQGMKDATNMFTNKISEWSAKSDSLKSSLENYLHEIKMDSINGDMEKLKVDQEKFLFLRQSYIKYQQNLEELSQKEDQQMTIGVINQLKEHIKNYALENGFDLIITNRELESVGYVNDKFEITDDLLKYADNHYEGKN